MRSVYLLFVLLVGIFVPVNGHAVDVPNKYVHGITIAHSSAMAPLAFEGYNKEPKGMLIDFWRKWSEKTGVPVSFELMGWKEGLECVSSGRCDVLGGLFRTKERDPLFDFSKGFWGLKTGLIVPKGSDINGMESLGNSRVGVLEKGSTEEFMRTHYPQVDIVPYPAVIDSTRALANGEIDALYMDYPTVMYMSGQLGAVKDLVLAEMVTENMLCAGVAKDNNELLELVQGGIDMISEPEIKQVMARWFVEPEEDSDKSMVFFSAIIIAFFCVLFFLFFGNPFRSSEKME